MTKMIRPLRRAGKIPAAAAAGSAMRGAAIGHTAPAMRALFAALVLACRCTHAKPMQEPMTCPALDAQLLADAAATYNFRLGLPAALAVPPDGAVLFRRTPPREFAANLYELDTKTGAIRTLVSVAELLGDGDEKLSDA